MLTIATSTIMRNFKTEMFRIKFNEESLSAHHDFNYIRLKNYEEKQITKDGQCRYCC